MKHPFSKFKGVLGNTASHTFYRFRAVPVALTVQGNKKPLNICEGS